MSSALLKGTCCFALQTPVRTCTQMLPLSTRSAHQAWLRDQCVRAGRSSSASHATAAAHSSDVKASVIAASRSIHISEAPCVLRTRCQTSACQIIPLPPIRFCEQLWHARAYCAPWPKIQQFRTSAHGPCACCVCFACMPILRDLCHDNGPGETSKTKKEIYFQTQIGKQKENTSLQEYHH